MFNSERFNDLINLIGSPYLYFENMKKVRSMEGIDKYFLDDFVFLHASLELFFLSYFDKLTICPFYDTGMCNFTKNNNCMNNCIENFMKDKYEMCLLNNSLLCTGIRSVSRWETKKIALCSYNNGT